MKKLVKFKYLSAVLLIVMCSYSANCFAEIPGKKKEVQQQTLKEDYGKTVTLVTSGSGTNEDEATRNALRNAIEQAYGTFVSSNTTVVNDELVSDAIASVSSGNVLGYEQISSISTPEGFSVSVRAVVSIGNLVSFATSHGMTTELAGNTFLINRNLARLNKKNEYAALINLADQLSIIVDKGMYDYSVDVSQPRMNSSGSTDYALDIKIDAKPNANYNLFWETIDRTLNSLSMSQSESANYQKMEMNTYNYSYGPSWDRFKIDTKSNLVGTKSKYILRNNIGTCAYGSPLSDKTTEIPLLEIIWAYSKIGKYSYELYDNIGNIVTPTIYADDSVTDDYRLSRELNGVRIQNKKFWILSKETTTTNHQLCRPYWSGEPGIVGHDFVIQYNENELSKLRNLSIRPHKINNEIRPQNTKITNKNSAQKQNAETNAEKPDHLLALKQIAKNYSDKEDYENAIAAYKKYLDACGEKASATDIAVLGQQYMYYAQQNPAQKVDALRKADDVFAKLAENPDAEEFATYKRAQVANQMDGGKGLAKPFYDKLIATPNCNIERLKEAYLYNISYFGNVKGDIKAAIPYAEKLAKLDPNNQVAKVVLSLK